MKSKVSALFNVLQLANSETDVNIKESVNPYDNKEVKNYGQLLAVRDMLSKLLTTCEVEIELSSGDEAVLVPFIQRHLTGR